VESIPGIILMEIVLCGNYRIVERVQAPIAWGVRNYGQQVMLRRDGSNIGRTS
jgi:hypothetical protein